MSKINFKYKGHELAITYDGQPEDESVGFKGSFEVEEIFLNKMDVTNLLEPQIDDIENELLKYFKEV